MTKAPGRLFEALRWRPGNLRHYFCPEKSAFAHDPTPRASTARLTHTSDGDIGKRFIHLICGRFITLNMIIIAPLPLTAANAESTSRLDVKGEYVGGTFPLWKIFFNQKVNRNQAPFAMRVSLDGLEENSSFVHFLYWACGHEVDSYASREIG